jgi:3-oxoacyl-[acyl-carrier-protein] synthase-1
MSSSARAVITGTGAVCGAGLTMTDIWNALETGRSAVAPIRQWDASAWPAPNAGEVKADNRTLVPDRKLHKMISRTDLFGLYAADLAVQESGLNSHRETLEEKAAAQFSDRSGVFVGSGGGTYGNAYDFFPLITAAHNDLPTFGRELSNTVNPMWLLRNLPNNVLCHVGIRHNLKGTNACITNQCVGGVLAAAEAGEAIRTGEADRAVVVGHDAPVEPETVLYYHHVGLLSNDALRPFDRERAGTVLGEGAAAAVFEKPADAQNRGATILGEFLGSGCATEATGVLDIRPDGEGVSRAIELALADAKISPSDVGMIVAHGNGTRASDASEAIAIKRVFGGNPPPVTGFKWAFGHLIAASGILDLVLALTALRKQIVPGIPNFTPDPELMPFPVSSQPQKPRSDVAVVICRGFGGMNVALVVRASAG